MMDRPKELIIQEGIEESLSLLKIYSASVLYVENAPSSIPSLCITFYPRELSEFLKLIDYDNLCDKSGILVLDKTETVIICGMSLDLLFNKLWGNLKRQ